MQQGQHNSNTNTSTSQSQGNSKGKSRRILNPEHVAIRELKQFFYLMKSLSTSETIRKEFLDVSSIYIKIQDPVDLIQLEKDARNGDLMSVMTLAFLYDGGSGLYPEDPEKAITYLTRAATEVNSSFACVQLGGRYLNGQGVPKSIKKATEWYKQGAELGNPMAQHKYAFFLDEGIGCQPNKLEAARWYEYAALQGYPWSMHNLGIMYSEGHPGVPKDMKKAIEFWQMAADKGYGDSAKSLAKLYMLGSPEDNIAVDEKKGIEMFKVAAVCGNAEAQRVLGMYHAVKGTPLYNIDIAIDYLSQAVMNGDSESFMLLARAKYVKEQENKPIKIQIPYESLFPNENQQHVVHQYSPDAEKLVQAVKKIREAHPDYGVQRMLQAVRDANPEWQVSEKRLHKILKENNLLVQHNQ